MEFQSQPSSFQFVSLPVKLFGNKKQAGCNQKDYTPSHSSLNATQGRQRNSNGQQLQLLTLRPRTSVKSKSSFPLDVFPVATPPNCADVSSKSHATSVQNKKKSHTHNLLKRKLLSSRSTCVLVEARKRKEGSPRGSYRMKVDWWPRQK